MEAFPKRKMLKEFAIFRTLNSPAKIQDFLNRMPQNFEPQRRTCRSPLMTLRANEAHCMEGSLLAAAALWYQGERPLLLDLRTTARDDDHVVTLFRRHGHWGAVSKTNHAVLRYRDPIYRTVRELALSYFNEYFLDDGAKTLRSYSVPFTLWRYGTDWLTSPEDLWDIPYDLDRSRHVNIVPQGGIRKLRLADPVEIAAGKITEWHKATRAPRRTLN